ncbi:MAG: hypothetical protein HQ557_16110 [Bacteroidetes bacterium]|nr:hypothetical protein [Bacteroidota bacterium]
MDLIMLFGTFASIIVAVSLTMKNIKLLRIVNLAGAVLFSIYGYLIGAIPVVVVNAFIAVIDIYYYVSLVRNLDKFDFVLNRDVKKYYTELFIKHYQKDIKKFFPQFKEETLPELKSAYILRNMVPVLILLYKDSEGEGEGVEIVLDYATPQFRDYKSSSYFFDYAAQHLDFDTSKKKFFKVYSTVAAHDKYLKKMGFKRVGESSQFRKAI